MPSSLPARIICYPGYTGNNYLGLIYKAFRIPVLLCEYTSDIGLREAALSPEASKGSIVHIHWIKELYACGNTASSYRLAQNLSYLERLKYNGCRLVWTIHNSRPHEWLENEQSVYRRAISEVCRLCDIIFQHSENAVELTEQLSGISLRNKRTVILPHPLYERLPINLLSCPPEISVHNLDNFMLLFGMIRSYKGARRLIRHYRSLVKRLGADAPSLVIAGRIYDRKFLEDVQMMKEELKSLVLIDRRLLESELGWLISQSRFCVQPYINILSSGSYYHAITYEKLCVVPRLGEFECDRSDRAILQAFSSDEQLENLLTYLSLLPRSRLDFMGRQALISNMHRNPLAISQQLYDSLKNL